MPPRRCICAARRTASWSPRQMQEIGVSPRAIVLEPMGRNHGAGGRGRGADDGRGRRAGHHRAAAVPTTSCATPRLSADAVVVAAGAAREGHVVTFGMAPSAPETGYGYVHLAAPISKSSTAPGASSVSSRSPTIETARGLSRRRRLFSGEQRHVRVPRRRADRGSAPAPRPTCSPPRARRSPRPSAISISCAWDADAFAGAPNISIDYALMEKTDRGRDRALRHRLERRRRMVGLVGDPRPGRPEQRAAWRRDRP